MYHIVFLEHHERLLTVNYFRQKTPSYMFGRILNTSLGSETYIEINQKSTMELFREIVLSEMFDWVLNMPPHKAQHAADQSTAFT